MVDITQVSAYNLTVRRKPDALLPIEADILGAALSLRTRGVDQFHGYALSKETRGPAGARLLTSHGTLYRALDRLEAVGFLRSEWEDPAVAAEENRPRRRLYTITADGVAKLSEWHTASRLHHGMVKGSPA